MKTQTHPCEEERQRFERWFRRQWKGISLRREPTLLNYIEPTAQAAWEVWWRFTRGKLVPSIRNSRRAA